MRRIGKDYHYHENILNFYIKAKKNILHSTKDNYLLNDLFIKVDTIWIVFYEHEGRNNNTKVIKVKSSKLRQLCINFLKHTTSRTRDFTVNEK